MTAGRTADQLQQYSRLLRRLDDWIRSIRARYAGQLQCGRGCSLCCHGLFDIPIPDAIRVAAAFESLPENVGVLVAQRAAKIQDELMKQRPDLEALYFLENLSEHQIDQLVEALGEVRCPFLDNQDSCLIYENRPIACRLEGIPMVDIRDGLFGDWCELNFTQGISPEIAADLRLDFGEIQAIEQTAAVFIPSVIVAVVNGCWDQTLGCIQRSAPE